VFVDPGCNLKLTDHFLSSEHNLYLDSNVRWIKWEDEDISQFGISQEDVEAAVSEAGIGEREILLADVVKLAKSRNRAPIWKILLGIVISFSLISLTALFAVPIIMRWVSRIQAKFRVLKNHLLSLILDLAEQLNRVLRHVHLPQVPLQRFNLYPHIQAPLPPLDNDPLAPPHPLPPYPHDQLN